VSNSPAQMRYLTDSVSTASPARLVVMLYDRLGLDLRRAAEAQHGQDPFAAAGHLLHAQQIIAELMSSLRVDLWPEGENLASLYSFMLTELIAVNTAADPARLAVVSTMVTELRDSWAAAGAALQDASAVSSTSADHMAWVG
jgi:flagellar protein FliS